MLDGGRHDVLGVDPVAAKVHMITRGCSHHGGRDRGHYPDGGSGGSLLRSDGWHLGESAKTPHEQCKR